MPNTNLVSPYETLTTIKICPAAARHIRSTSFNKWFSSVGLQADFCVFGGTIWKYWSRFVLTTDGATNGHLWMQSIAEAVGKFLKGDWDSSQLITGGIIGGHYCTWLGMHHILWWTLHYPEKNQWVNKALPCERNTADIQTYALADGVASVMKLGLFAWE